MKISQPQLKISTWNVNSINVRLERLINFLKREAPDIVCLQELKCLEEKFPFEALETAGYHSTVFGQKTYNGVAILSKSPPEKVWKGMEDKVDDPAARLVGANVAGVNVICVYVPNGQEVGSEKYKYKLQWMKRFTGFLQNHFTTSSPVLVCGDFNVAPEDKDVYDPAIWKDQILFSENEKKALAAIMEFGLVDTFRKTHPHDQAFTWWDYRNLSFPKNLGLRIDFILGSQSMIDSLIDSYVDRNERKGVQPSDHAPVISVFNRELLESKLKARSKKN
jgi:exodeoxyribonuclease-3